MSSASSSATSSSSISASAVTMKAPSSKAFTIPDDWTSEPFDKPFVVDSLRVDLKRAFDEKLNMLYGTSVTAVLTAFLKALFNARKVGDPSGIIADMVFSVFVSQTVSREWARLYPSLGRNTMFATFEINGNRAVDAKVPASSWVNSSNMNATAVGYLGHIIMECCSKRTSLGKKAATNGTIFNPIVGETPSEYATICKATHDSLSDQDKKAPGIFAEHASHLVEAVEAILEGGGSDIEEVLNAIRQLKIKKF